MRTNRIKQLSVLATLGALTISAIAPASAPAATWTIEGATQAIGFKESTVTQQKAGTMPVFEWTLLGQTVVIESQQLTMEGGYIDQAAAGAVGGGHLVLRELTVTKPVNCVVSDPIRTKLLKATLVPHESTNIAFWRFQPAEGTVLATIKVEKCALSGSYNLSGVLYGQGEEWTVEKAEQPLTFSPAINETLKGTLSMGGSPARFKSEWITVLSGSNPGKAFGAHK